MLGGSGEIDYAETAFFELATNGLKEVVALQNPI